MNLAAVGMTGQNQVYFGDARIVYEVGRMRNRQAEVVLIHAL